MTPPDIRLEAVKNYLSQGLTVVPYHSPWDRVKKPGKSPHYWPVPPYRRIECNTVGEFLPVLQRYPNMNIGLLGIVQIDADDVPAITMAAVLGVKSDRSCWIVQTKRGYKALYRPPKDVGEYVDVSRKWCVHCPHTGEHPDQPFQLDLLAKVPAIVPPSIHPQSKLPYQWVGENSPDHIPFHRLDQPPDAVLARWRMLNNGVPRPPTTPGRISGSLVDEIKHILAGWARHGSLPQPNARGWINLHCGLETHDGPDRSPSFGVNFDGNAFNCYVCGAGNLKDLARRLHIQPVGAGAAWEVRG